MLVLVLVYALEAPIQVLELPVSIISVSGISQFPYPQRQQIHDARTGCGRTANSDLGSVAEVVVCDAERPATAFAQLAGLFHGLETSAVLLKNAKGATLVDPPRKAKRGLAGATTEMAGATTEMIRVHGRQRDEYQRQECFGREHGSSCEGFGESDDYPKLLKADGSTFVSREMQSS